MTLLNKCLILLPFILTLTEAFPTGGTCDLNAACNAVKLNLPLRAFQDAVVGCKPAGAGEKQNPCNNQPQSLKWDLVSGCKTINVPYPADPIKCPLHGKPHEKREQYHKLPNKGQADPAQYHQTQQKFHGNHHHQKGQEGTKEPPKGGDSSTTGTGNSTLTGGTSTIPDSPTTTADVSAPTGTGTGTGTSAGDSSLSGGNCDLNAACNAVKLNLPLLAFQDAVVGCKPRAGASEATCNNKPDKLSWSFVSGCQTTTVYPTDQTSCPTTHN